MAALTAALAVLLREKCQEALVLGYDSLSDNGKNALLDSLQAALDQILLQHIATVQQSDLSQTSLEQQEEHPIVAVLLSRAEHDQGEATPLPPLSVLKSIDEQLAEWGVRRPLEIVAQHSLRVMVVNMQESRHHAPPHNGQRLLCQSNSCVAKTVTSERSAETRASMKAIDITDLVLFKAMQGCKLVGCLAVSPCYLSGIMTGMYDEYGNFIEIALYNQMEVLSHAAVKAAFPKGATITIYEPFLKIFASGAIGIRVDSPEDIHILHTTPTTPLSTALSHIQHLRKQGYLRSAVQTCETALITHPDIKTDAEMILRTAKQEQNAHLALLYAHSAVFLFRLIAPNKNAAALFRECADKVGVEDEEGLPECYELAAMREVWESGVVDSKGVGGNGEGVPSEVNTLRAELAFCYTAAGLADQALSASVTALSFDPGHLRSPLREIFQSTVSDPELASLHVGILPQQISLPLRVTATYGKGYGVFSEDYDIPDGTPLVRDVALVFGAKEAEGRGCEMNLIRRPRGGCSVDDSGSLSRAVNLLSFRVARDTYSALAVQWMQGFPAEQGVVGLRRYVSGSALQELCRPIDMRILSCLPNQEDYLRTPPASALSLILTENSFSHPISGETLLFPLLTFINHNDTPNARVFISDCGRTATVFAIRDIAPFEEILIEYEDDPEGLRRGWGIHA